MDKSVKNELNKQEPSAFHVAVLQHAKKLVDRSRGHMSSHYDDWDMRDETFQGKRRPDEEDRKSSHKGEPIKMTAPTTFAQVMTFVSFGFLLYGQNPRQFELTASGEEDWELNKKEDTELVLDRDCRKNTWSAKRFQFFLDIGKFGLGVMEGSWSEEYQNVSLPSTETDESYGAPTITETVNKQRILKFQGNRIRNISPYSFFPDTTLPMSRLQEGEFVAVEEPYTWTQLKRMESDGEVAGLKWVTGMNESAYNERSKVTRMDGFKASKGNERGRVVCVTKMQVSIVPKDFQLDDGSEGKPLGPEDYPVKYHVWYANDQRVIRCEPMNALHDRYTYVVGEYLPDMHHLVNVSMADLIDRLQSMISWFINSHVASVKQMISNRLVVDPAGVDMDSLRSGDPVILLKRGKSQSGAERWVHQLNVADATGNHMSDADRILALVQMVTGANDNAMGQYNGGRRSATEARAVTSGAASRMKTQFTVIFDTAVGPLGQMMLTNARQSLTFETFLRVVGRPPAEDVQGLAMMQQRFDTFKGELEDVVGEDDYFIFDATQQSEKGYIAQSLQEFLVALISNPQAAVLLDIDPKALFDEINTLRGNGPMKRFSLQKRLAAEAQQQGTQPVQPTQPLLNGPTIGGGGPPSQS